jgi:DNA-binding CsgD family transcriptional regulator
MDPATCEREWLDLVERFADEAVQASWREVAGSWGSPSQRALPLHVGPHSHRAFVMGRADPFTADEVQLALTLQRLLRGLDRQVVAARTRFDARSRDVATSMHLTPRELAVLGELAEGLTAAAIGRKLVITERTVHKHLERLYTRFGVGDRLAAVLRAQRLGLLPARWGSVHGSGGGVCSTAASCCGETSKFTDEYSRSFVSRW